MKWLVIFSFLLAGTGFNLAAANELGWEITVKAKRIEQPGEPEPKPKPPVDDAADDVAEAADDVKAEAEEVKAPEEKEDAAEPPKKKRLPEPATVRFHGQIIEIGLEASKLQATATGEVIEVPTKNLISIRRPVWIVDPADSNEEQDGLAGYTIVLKSGGELTGLIAEFGKDALKLETQNFGNLTIPNSTVSSIAKIGEVGKSKRAEDKVSASGKSLTKESATKLGGIKSGS